MMKEGSDTRKNKENEKIVKVFCDCCGTKIECPEEMMKTSKKHVCFSCFQDPEKIKAFTDEERRNVHVDMPMDEIYDIIADNLTSVMVKETFPEIWSEKKEEFKAFSKKELAQEMFGAGIYLGVQAFIDALEEMKEQRHQMKSKVKR